MQEVTNGFNNVEWIDRENRTLGTERCENIDTK